MTPETPSELAIWLTDPEADTVAERHALSRLTDFEWNGEPRPSDRFRVRPEARAKILAAQSAPSLFPADR